MPRLIWSPRSLADVSRLHRFLVPKNPDAAKRAVKTIRAGVKILLAHPEAGKAAEGMAEEFREWPIGFGRRGYFVLYRYDGDMVIILAVRHFQEAGY